ncbi:MAG: hypothetical protein RIR47_124 [Bacteroidota bacterium]|jgi:hypothetical protein
MATHFINYSETPVYLRTTPVSSSTSNVVYTLTEDIQIDLIEEYVYDNCDFHYVKIDDTSITSINQNEYYVATKDINRLFNTPESAPVNCEDKYTSVTTYEEPDWLSRPIDITYFNPRDLVYKVPISTPYRFINSSNREQFNDYCLTKGIKKILDYLSKDYTDESIEQYKSYFRFAEIEDYEVPLRELARIKALVTCHIKYLNAIPLNTQGMMQKTTQIIKVKTHELKKKIDFIFMKGDRNSLFKYYHRESSGTDFKGGFSFENEGKQLLQIYNDIIRLCKINDAPYSETRKQDYYEICLDDCQNIVYMSYFDAKNKTCIPVTTGMVELNKKVKKFKYNPIFYLKEVDAISLIDFCKLPYTEFINIFCFYKPSYSIEKSTLEDYLADFFNMTDEEIYALVEKFVTKIEDEQKNEKQRQFQLLIKKKEAAKKLAEARKNLSLLEKQKAAKKRSNIKIGGTLSQADFRDLDEQIAEAESEYNAALAKIEAMKLNFSDKFLNVEQLNPVEKALKNRLRYMINTFSSQFVGLFDCDPDIFGSEDNEFMKWLNDTQEETAKPKKKSTFKEKREKAAEFSKDIYPKIQKIYSELFKCISLCTISEKLLKCITAALDFLDISLSITKGNLASFTYEEFKTKIIPNLQESDKRIFYDSFITSDCIKQKDIIEIFIKATGDRTYADTLSVVTYDEAKAQLIEELV